MSVRNQILILLACSLLAGKTAIGWSGEADVARSDVQGAETRAKRQELLLTTVNERLETDLPVSDSDPLIESRLATTVAKLNRLAKPNLIDINQTVPEGVATGSALRPVGDLVQKTAAGMPFIRLQVKGQYRTLQGLHKFTQVIAQGYVSISKLKVERDTFELDLEVYGGA